MTKLVVMNFLIRDGEFSRYGGNPHRAWRRRKIGFPRPELSSRGLRGPRGPLVRYREAPVSAMTLSQIRLKARRTHWTRNSIAVTISRSMSDCGQAEPRTDHRVETAICNFHPPQRREVG